MASQSLGRWFGTEDREGFRPVERVFHPQQAAEFIIGLLSIESRDVLNTDPFMAAEHVAAHVPAEASVHLPGFEGYVVTEEAHNVGALEGAQAVDHKGAIGASQIARVSKEQVGGVFALGDGPVVEQIGKGFENLLPQGVSWRQQSVEQLQPVGAAPTSWFGAGRRPTLGHRQDRPIQ